MEQKFEPQKKKPNLFKRIGKKIGNVALEVLGGILTAIYENRQ